MKNKIFNILGIATVLVTLLSLFGLSAPVSAGTQSWTKIDAPAVMRYVVFVGPMALAKDGVLYTSVGISGDPGSSGANNGVWIYKSTDGGRTWKKTGTQPGQRLFSAGVAMGLASNITVNSGKNTAVYTDIQCPGPDGNMVYATDGYDIFKSIDGGNIWIPLTNLFEKLDDDLVENPVGYIVSISTGFIGGSVSPSAYTFAATTTFGGTGGLNLGHSGNINVGHNGGVYVLQESVFLNPWADDEVDDDRPVPWGSVSSKVTDVLKVQTFPDFATTQGVMAVVSDYTGNRRTIVTTKYGAGQWDTTANDVILKYNPGGHPPSSNVTATLLGASIYIPTDFSSNPASANMIAFVGIDPVAGSTVQGDVYLCYFGPAAATPFTPTVAYDLGVDTDEGVGVSGMSGVGPAATASIMVSGFDQDDDDQPNVWTTRNGGVSWTTTDDNINAKRPTGGASMPDANFNSGWLGLYPVALSSCVVMSDFATSGKGLVGTHGTDCGLSLTQDWGLSFNTIAFIATRITATDDLSLATDSTMYMSTDFAAPGVTAGSFTASAVVSSANADSVDLQFVNSPDTPNDDVITGRLTLLAGATLPTVTFALGTGSSTATDTVVIIDSTHMVITLGLGGEGTIAHIAATAAGTLFALDVTVTEPLESPSAQDRDATFSLTAPGGSSAVIGGPSYNASTQVYSYNVLLPNLFTYATGGFTLVVPAGATASVSGAVTGNSASLTAGSYPITVGPTGPVALITNIGAASAAFIAQTPVATNPVLSGSFSYPHTYTLVAGVSASAVEYYSLWRYSGGFWERINSWSLYGPTLLPDFDFIQTTPDQAALFTVDINPAQNQLYRSTNKGQVWFMWGQPFPATLFKSWLVASPTTVAIGTTGGLMYTTTNGTVWLTRQVFVQSGTAFTNTTITDIRLAGNGDWLAAGADNLGDINAAKSSNQGATWTAKDLGLAARFTGNTKAFIGAAADYATSGVVYVTSNGTAAGVYWGTLSGDFTKADSVTDDWYQGNGATGLITSPGGPGFAAEGTGMAYTDAVTRIGLERIKGRVATTATAAGEFIPADATGPADPIHGLWVAGNAVGGVALYTITDAGVIWTYTDTLNVAVSGVTATAVTATSCLSTCPVGTAGGTIKWNAVTNANLYFVIIDTVQWTNFYDANDWAETHPGVAVLTTALSNVWTGLPNTSYYVSVWALKTTSTFTESLPGSFEGLEGRVLSTFGSSASFTTPLPSPTGLSPDTTTFNVPVMPTFSWVPVPGATGYQLQISKTADFSTLVFDSGTTTPLTSSSYVYTGTALTNSTGYYWRVRALGTNNSDWVTAVFSTVPVTAPPVTVSQLPQPTIIVTNPPAVTVTVAAPVPAPIITITQPSYTIAQPDVQTPTYIWIIVGVGALLTLAVIILIIRTRRVV